MLKNLGNHTTNAILESTLQSNSQQQLEKLAAKESGLSKQSFIRDKYELHRFTDQAHPSDNTPDEATRLLFNALDNDDIPQALNALIQGADPNGQRPISSLNRPTTLAAYESPLGSEIERVLLPVLDINGNLVHDRTTSVFIPVQQQQTTDQPSLDDISAASIAAKTVRFALHFALLHPRLLEKDSISNDNDDDRTVFPMAELLVQNGARLDLMDSATGYEISELLSFGDILSDQAIMYLNTKNQARGRSPIFRTPLPSHASPHPPLPTHSAPM